MVVRAIEQEIDYYSHSKAYNVAQQGTVRARNGPNLRGGEGDD